MNTGTYCAYDYVINEYTRVKENLAKFFKSLTVAEIS